MVEAGGHALRVMRDPTRGGLAATLNELAAQSGVAIEIEEAGVPINPDVRLACELLGIDPHGRLPHPQGCVAYVSPLAGGNLLSGGLLTEIMA